MASADGPAFVAAAVRAAILAKAPRRTVQAVAAAVTGVFVRPTAAAAPVPAAMAQAMPESADAAVEATGASLEEMVAKLQAVRRAQRKKKKENRKARKRAGQMSPAASEVSTKSVAMFFHDGWDELLTLPELQKPSESSQAEVPLPPKETLVAEQQKPTVTATPRDLLPMEPDWMFREVDSQINPGKNGYFKKINPKSGTLVEDDGSITQLTPEECEAVRQVYKRARTAIISQAATSSKGGGQPSGQ